MGNKGAIFQPFIRIVPSIDFNPTGMPNVTAAMSRQVSNVVMDQVFPIPSNEQLSDMFNMWGQFLIHNMAHALPDNAFPWYITVPRCDTYFDPSCSGVQAMPYFRTRVGEVECNPRNIATRKSNGLCSEQINSLGAYIDANPVYGSSKEVCDLLRSFNKGEMKSSSNPFGEMPPRNVPGITMDNDARRVPTETLYHVGERRANENPGLMAIQSILLREHNRMAKVFAYNHQDWDDETIFQHTRSCIIEQVQHITYKEYLPSLLGSFPDYSGYDPNTNAQISNEFTTVAFRFGHSEVGPVMEYGNEDGSFGTPLPIRDSYFNPAALDDGLEPIIRGLVLKQEENIDIFMISDLRNFLFGRPGRGGFDLAARNLQRSRDHGIPPYNLLRMQFGLEPVYSWSDITNSTVIQERLKLAYNNDIDLVDAFIGGLAEDHLDGASVGQLFHTIIVEQFLRTRRGDRFWYEAPHMRETNKECQTTDFGHLIRRNTQRIGMMPKNVFFVPKNNNPLCAD
eukprot:gene13710-16163_t